MLKSRKRLAIILTVISVFVVLLVLGSALFSLQGVSIEFALVKTENSVLATYDKDAMVKAGNFSYGKNILFLNFDKNMEKIEKAFPYAKVVKVTRNFPNKAIVYVTEREPMFKVTQPDGSAYILDAELKVLKHATGIMSAVDSNLPEWTDFPFGLTSTAASIEVGTFISNDHLKNVIVDIYSGIIDNDVNLSMGVMSSITITTSGTGEEKVTLKLDDGETIEINGTNYLAEKVLGAFKIWQTEVSQLPEKYPDRSQVVITVTSNFRLENAEIGISVSGGID